jgi:hypothetical protein
MTKKEYGDLLAEIGGGSQIGLSARRERDAAEKQVLELHDTEFWALLCLGDATHQFYRDTLGLLVDDSTVGSITDIDVAMVTWHIVSFGRFAAAFDLMAKGYYFETMMLARDLWEVSLSLAALRKKVVTIEELTASDAATPQEAERLSRQVDARVKKTLVTDNEALGDQGREAVTTFLRFANQATHKSKLHFALNVSRAFRGRGVPLFPHFDIERAGAEHNILTAASWSLVSTLPYLPFPASPARIGWDARYAKMQRAFREGPGRNPVAMLEAWPDVVDHVFGSQTLAQS